MITDGKYKARACGQVVLGTSEKKGTPFVELYFRIIDVDQEGKPGPNHNGEVKWTAYFSDNEKAKARTVESLFYCGWETDDGDISAFVDSELHGLDANEVQIDVELEEYETEEGEKRTAPRVQWVNKLGGFLNVKNAMKKEEAASFGEKMKGLVLKMKAKQPAPSADAADFPHGANEKPAEEAKRAGGTKKGW